MKTMHILILSLLLTACHHNNHRNERKNAPDYRRNDSYRQEHDRRQRSWPRHSDTDDNIYRLHRQQGFLPPVGMRWDCPAEPQMLGYVTR